MPITDFVIDTLTEPAAVDSLPALEACKRYPPPEVKSVAEGLLWRALNAGHSVLISGGGAGVGKSYLCKQFIEAARESLGNRLVVTAPTAKAAGELGGVTLHKALGLGLAKDDPRQLLSKLQNARSAWLKRSLKFLTQTDILLIDEISMLDIRLFRIIEFLARSLRKDKGIFGGMQLVMCGDFLQLPPIPGENDAKTQGEEHLFETEAFKALSICRLWLLRVMRQSDARFIELLNHVRFGRLTAEDNKMLADKLLEAEAESQPHNLGLVPLHIFSYRKEVQQANERKFQSLLLESRHAHHFKPRVVIEHRPGPSEPGDQQAAQAMAMSPKDLESHFPVYEVQVCEGAQVMCRCNHWFESHQIANGSLGVVVAVTPNHITCNFLNARGEEVKALEVTRYNFRMGFGKSVDVVMSQFPLTLAWATTIHAVQGLTLDYVHIGARTFFASGQFYVALSRARSWAGVTLANIPRTLDVSAACARFETPPVARAKRPREIDVCEPSEPSEPSDAECSEPDERSDPDIE